MKLPKLKDRIRTALAGSMGMRMVYADLAYKVFPQEHFPNAFRYQSNGGPPGCYMALSRAIREMRDAGEVQYWRTDVGPGHWHIQLKE